MAYLDLPDICRAACFSPNGHLIALGIGNSASIHSLHSDDDNQ